MSSRVIPGNARAVNRLINQMYRMGPMSATTDAPRARFRPWSRDELRTMLDAVRPKFFVPIHGEYRHLIQHRDLARDWGIAPERTFILDDGEPLTLLPDTIRLEEKIPADSILVDGKGVGDVAISFCASVSFSAATALSSLYWCLTRRPARSSTART